MLQDKLKIDDKIMKLLNASTIRRPICLTNKGALELCVRKGESNYFLTLDSVPIEKELNDKLMNILFKPEVPQTILHNLNGKTETSTIPEMEKIIEKLPNKSYYKSKSKQKEI